MCSGLTIEAIFVLTLRSCLRVAVLLCSFDDFVVVAPAIPTPVDSKENEMRLTERTSTLSSGNIVCTVLGTQKARVLP